MKRAVVFWAIILIAVGVLLLLGALGVIPIGWGLIWPLLLIAVGGWLVWGRSPDRGKSKCRKPASPWGTQHGLT